MRIAVACDHGGFALKQAIVRFLESSGNSVKDFGCYSEESADYADFAFPAAEAVADGQCDRGILICTTGIGVSICANKVRGIRCALCTDETMARLTREHNDSNMLALGGRIVGTELAKAIVSTWLTTEFSKGTRHIGRIGKIEKYEA